MALNNHIIDLSQAYKQDEESIGKKAHELGMLWRLGILLPKGFVLTSKFFKEFLRLTGIDKEISNVQALDHPALSGSIGKLFTPIQKKIMQTHLPQNLSNELQRSYRELSGILKEQSLSIYSSSKNDKSTVFRNVKGDANLVLKIKEIWTSHLNNTISIVVQKNINSKNKGKMFTNDSLINDQNLTKLAKKIQNFFYFPQEVNYVIKNNKIYVTQIKPFTGTVDSSSKQSVQIKRAQKLLVKGISINQGIATGPVKVFNKNQNVIHAKNGEIIVLSEINASLYNKIKNARAIIIDSILQKPLDKILYRKLIKTPTIEGTENAAKILRNGNIVTVNGMSGEIYSGGLI